MVKGKAVTLHTVEVQGERIPGYYIFHEETTLVLYHKWEYVFASQV
jgi:hypothetical protein